MKTDSQLQSDVQAELKWEPSVNATHIGVEVQDGIVTLNGHVGSYTEKWAAETATQRVAGVRALAVEMDVKLAGSDQRNDADIARPAEGVLKWTTTLARDDIQVRVEKGWITLTGQVEWEFQRNAATSVVRHLMGVTGVSDQITLKPRIGSGVIKADIEAAFQRRAHEDGKGIGVAVSGSDVTLTGVVHSWSERALARHSAWRAPGVTNVVDNITVAY